MYDTDLPSQGHIAQSVSCLTADMCLTADPGVVSLILASSHTFLEIDHEIISAAIPLPSADSVTSESMRTKYWLTLSQACPGKSMVR